MLLKQIPYFLMSWMHHMVLMIFFPYFLCPISEIMINWLETSIGKGRRRKLLGNYKLPDNFVLSRLASLPAWTKLKYQEWQTAQRVTNECLIPFLILQFPQWIMKCLGFTSVPLKGRKIHSDLTNSFWRNFPVIKKGGKYA